MKLKKKYIILISIFIFIFSIFLYSIIDYFNDISYLKNQTFIEQGMVLDKEFTGYGKYCENSSNIKEGDGIYCDIYYWKQFLYPHFGMNINMGDNTALTYTKYRRGLNKREEQDIVIQFNTDTQIYDAAYCRVDSEFNVLEDDKNDSFCYSDDYINYMNEHKEYISDALTEYNLYYDNFSLARSFI